MMGINAVKGVEIGAGFSCGDAARVRSMATSCCRDGFVTNHAGGVLGGISSGQDIEVSIAVKPTSSIRLPRRSITRAGVATVVETHGRHDPCVGIRATPIAEAMLALVLMDHALLHRAQNADVHHAVAPTQAARVFVVLMLRDAPLTAGLAARGALRRVLRLCRHPRAVLPLYFQWRGLTAFEVGVLIALGQAMRVDRPEPVGISRRPRATPYADPAQRPPIALLLTFVPAALARRLRVRVRSDAAGQSLPDRADADRRGAGLSLALRGRADAATRYGRLRHGVRRRSSSWCWRRVRCFDRFGIGDGALGSACSLWTASWWPCPGRCRTGSLPNTCTSACPCSRRLREPRVRWFLLSAALMVFAHGALYTYLSIYLAQLGYSKTAIGVFWVLSVVLEIVFFYDAGSLVRALRHVSAAAGEFFRRGAAVCLIAKLATVWWILAFAQILHAVTFAVHHSASVLTIQRWFPGRGRGARAGGVHQRGLRRRRHGGQPDRGILVDAGRAGVGVRLRQYRRAAGRLGCSREVRRHDRDRWPVRMRSTLNEKRSIDS